MIFSSFNAGPGTMMTPRPRALSTGAAGDEGPLTVQPIRQSPESRAHLALGR